MAKIVLEDTNGGYNIASINRNFQKLQNELNHKVLYRLNDVPFESNAWLSPMDANGKRLYNLPEPVNQNEAARLKDVQMGISGLPSANLIPFTPYSDIASDTVQGAIQEVYDDVLAYIAQFASSIGSSLVGFIQSGVGAIQRTVQDKLRTTVSPEDFGGTGSDAFQKALDASSHVKLTPGVTYTLAAPLVKTGRLLLEAEGAIVECDGPALKITNGSFSRVSGGYWKNIADAYIIQRDPNTWADNVAADVTIGTEGYLPDLLDSDIYAGLSPTIQNQIVGPVLEFTSTSSAPVKGVTVSGMTGQFLTIVLEGCTQSTVEGNSFQAGKDYAGIIFYNATNLSRKTQTPMGYSFARGIANRAVNNSVIRATGCGITYFGNDYFTAQSNTVQGCGESGIKTYQTDATYGLEVICQYGSISDNTSIENRFDGIDVSATYPTAGTQPGHNRVIGNMSRNNRGTGIFSDAQSNHYIGNHCLDNGLGGMTLQAANLMVSNNYLENNVRLPNIFGPFNSYDLNVDGDNCYVLNNTILRTSTPNSVYAMFHGGTGGSNSQNYVPTYPTFVSNGNFRNVAQDITRTKKVSTSFVEYMITDEPNSVQSVLKLWRTASTGNALSFFQGSSETGVGSIAITGTSTSYNTSSDYRLKYDQLPLGGGLYKIMQLAPKQWKWTVDGSYGEGFIAHELGEVIPLAVTGVQDQVDDGGVPIYQSIDKSYIIPYLVKAVQELKIELDNLSGK